MQDVACNFYMRHKAHYCQDCMASVRSLQNVLSHPRKRFHLRIGLIADIGLSPLCSLYIAPVKSDIAPQSRASRNEVAIAQMRISRDRRLRQQRSDATHGSPRNSRRRALLSAAVSQQDRPGAPRHPLPQGLRETGVTPEGGAASAEQGVASGARSPRADSHGPYGPPRAYARRSTPGRRTMPFSAVARPTLGRHSGYSTPWGRWRDSDNDTETPRRTTSDENGRALTVGERWASLHANSNPSPFGDESEDESWRLQVFLEERRPYRSSNMQIDVSLPRVPSYRRLAVAYFEARYAYRRKCL